MGRIVLPEYEYFPVYSNGIRLKPTEKTLIYGVSEGYGVYGNVYEYGDSDEIVFEISDDDYEPYTTYFICDGRMVSIFVEFDPAKTYYSALFYFKKGDASSDICVFSQDVLTHLDYYDGLGISNKVLVVDRDQIPPYFENAVYGVAFETNEWVNGKQWFELNTVAELSDGDYLLKDVTEFVKKGEKLRISTSYNGDKPLYITYDNRNVTLTGDGMYFENGGTDHNVCAIYGQGIKFKIVDAGNVASDGSFITVNGVKAGIMAPAESIYYSIEGQSYVELGLEDVPV